MENMEIIFLISGHDSEIWKSKKQEENIIPIGLRERDFKTFPTKEVKKPAPKFSSILGKNVVKVNLIC